MSRKYCPQPIFGYIGFAMRVHIFGRTVHTQLALRSMTTKRCLCLCVCVWLESSVPLLAKLDLAS